MRSCRLLLLCTLALTSCNSSNREEPRGTPDPTSAPPATPAATTTTCAATGPEQAKLRTEDGLTLEADFYASGQQGSPAAVLLHMIPPNNDRSNYPRKFITALLDAGFGVVLNVDRRGAGNSEGDAKDAYRGDKGKLDALAAYQFLAAHACQPDLSRLAVVGASNGTTTAVDFTVHAAGAAKIEKPRALVFLTGGGYTESQNSLDKNRAALDPVPILFVFSKAERSWSAGIQADAPSAWEFKEYEENGHGTKIFGAVPESVEFVATWAASKTR